MIKHSNNPFSGYVNAAVLTMPFWALVVAILLSLAFKTWKPFVTVLLFDILLVAPILWTSRNKA